MQIAFQIESNMPKCKMHVIHKYLFNNNAVYIIYTPVINQHFERSYLSPVCIQFSCVATSNCVTTHYAS